MLTCNRALVQDSLPSIVMKKQSKVERNQKINHLRLVKPYLTQTQFKCMKQENVEIKCSPEKRSRNKL